MCQWKKWSSSPTAPGRAIRKPFRKCKPTCGSEKRPRFAWFRKSFKRRWQNMPAIFTLSPEFPKRPYASAWTASFAIFRAFHEAFKLRLISRIKILSDMDIAERRSPQDGRFMVSIGRPADRPSRLDLADPIWGESCHPASGDERAADLVRRARNTGEIRRTSRTCFRCRRE